MFRAVPVAPRTEELPAGGRDLLADAQRGLIVITGPTGSGKSTTGAAVVDLINSRRPLHILTIEDPIEYLHRDAEAIVCQREIGLDAPTYHTALRAALRQDPDVILIGEVRDEETAMTALRAAETGHLVICTLHTLNATETVQRFIDLFGDRQSSLARQMLAATLVGITSQRLVPGRDGSLVLNSEVLVNSARIRDLIARASPRASSTWRSARATTTGCAPSTNACCPRCATARSRAPRRWPSPAHRIDFKLTTAADLELAAAEDEGELRPRPPVGVEDAQAGTAQGRRGPVSVLMF